MRMIHDWDIDSSEWLRGRSAGMLDIDVCVRMYDETVLISPDAADSEMKSLGVMSRGTVNLSEEMVTCP